MEKVKEVKIILVFMFVVLLSGEALSAMKDDIVVDLSTGKVIKKVQTYEELMAEKYQETNIIKGEISYQEKEVKTGEKWGETHYFDVFMFEDVLGRVCLMITNLNDGAENGGVALDCTYPNP